MTPEMATAGYFWDHRARIAPYVEPIPGLTTDRFTALARELNVHIVLGLAEKDPDTGNFYNTAVLLGPEGLVGRYRKVHPYMAEAHWAKNGRAVRSSTATSPQGPTLGTAGVLPPVRDVPAPGGGPGDSFGRSGRAGSP